MLLSIAYLLEEMYYLGVNLQRWVETVGKPYEGDEQLLTFGNLRKESLIESVTLAHLALHAVALDGTLEMPLRYAYEYLHRCTVRTAFHECIDGLQWECRRSLAVAALEKLVYKREACDALVLFKCTQ